MKSLHLYILVLWCFTETEDPHNKSRTFTCWSCAAISAALEQLVNFLLLIWWQLGTNGLNLNIFPTKELFLVGHQVSTIVDMLLMFTLLFQSSQFEQKLVGSIDAWLLMKCILVTLKHTSGYLQYRSLRWIQEYWNRKQRCHQRKDPKNLDWEIIMKQTCLKWISKGSRGFKFFHFL